MVDALNRFPTQVEPVGIPDQTIDAHMFILELELQSVYDYLSKRMMPKSSQLHKTIFISES